MWLRRKLYGLNFIAGYNLVDFSLNYFQIFQLDVSFQLDLTQLSDRFHDLQQTVHPDKFVSASEQEKRLAVQWATHINGAYTTLKYPLARAIYLLELRGVDIKTNPSLDPSFLMEQVALREELEDIEGKGEEALPLLDQYKKQVTQVLCGYEEDFARQYQSENLEHETTQTVYKLQFVNKLLISANQLEEKLLDY